MIGGKVALLTIMNNKDAEIVSTISTFNTAMTETASEILSIGKNEPGLRTSLGKSGSGPRTGWQEQLGFGKNGPEQELTACFVENDRNTEILKPV